MSERSNKDINQKKTRIGFYSQKVIPIIVTIVILIGGALYFLKIITVQCVGNDYLCKTINTKKPNGNIGEYFYVVFKSKLLKMLSENKSIKKYSVRYVFPRKALIEISKENDAYLLLMDNGIIAKISKDGYVNEITEQSNIISLKSNNPTVTPDGVGGTDSINFSGKTMLIVKGYVLNQGNYIDKNLLNALRILKIITNYYKVDSHNYDNQILTVTLKDQTNLIIPTDKNIDYLTGCIKLILSRLNQVNKDITIDSMKKIKIDLRYNNPILYPGLKLE